LTAALFAACDEKITSEEETSNPVSGLKKIQDFPLNDYIASAWNETGEWHLGYTKVYFTVKNKEGSFVENVQLSAFPEMDMGTVKHSTPRSEIIKKPGKALYEAWYAFLMYSGQGEGKWYYNLRYTIGNETDSVADVEIDVKNVFRPDGKTERKIIQTLVSIDESEKRYVVSLVEPLKPKIGSNEITAYIHERKDANTYTLAENFTLKLDPRMPSMENHSSPNNADLIYDSVNKIYKGVVNFSMTGYWKLNLILLNEKGETLYGNPISDKVEASSLYFEMEF
jgi:hypothetical protein